MMIIIQEILKAQKVFAKSAGLRSRLIGKTIHASRWIILGSLVVLIAEARCVAISLPNTASTRQGVGAARDENQGFTPCG